MNYYNGEFIHSFFIIVESKSHDTTRDFMRRFKNAVDPWFMQIKQLKETKSARKGDVLIRTLYIEHQAYATDMIVFNEMLRCLIWQYNLHFDINVSLDDRGTIPKNSTRNLIG